jgi:hypothetical protein
MSTIPIDKVTKRTKRKEGKHTSLILQTGKRHDSLYLVPVESISSPATVIDNPGSTSNHGVSLLVIRPRSK